MTNSFYIDTTEKLNFYINGKKTSVLLMLVITSCFILSDSALASNPSDNFSSAPQIHLTENLNDAVKTALSPLLVLSLKLAYQQTTSDTINPLLVMFGLFLLLTLLKDILPVSIVKKPLDAAEELTSPLPALLGLTFVLPELTGHLTPHATEAVQCLLNSVGPNYVHAASDLDPVTGVSTLAQYLGGAVAALTGAIVYVAVWLLSNTLTILCMIVPALLGPIVKSCRLILLGFLYALNSYSPTLAMLVSLVIIIMAFLLCRWTFKLTVWGGIYSFDLLTLAWQRHKPGREPMAFITGNGQKVLKIAKRTFGRLILENGRLIFRYRHFLLFPREIELPLANQIVIGRRLTTPMLLQRSGNNLVPLLTFRLACRTHEELLSQYFGGIQIQEVGLNKWLKGAWTWMNTTRPTASTAAC